MQHDRTYSLIDGYLLPLRFSGGCDLRHNHRLNSTVAAQFVSSSGRYVSHALFACAPTSGLRPLDLHQTAARALISPSAPSGGATVAVTTRARDEQPAEA